MEVPKREYQIFKRNLYRDLIEAEILPSSINPDKVRGLKIKLKHINQWLTNSVVQKYGYRRNSDLKYECQRGLKVTFFFQRPIDNYHLICQLENIYGVLYRVDITVFEMYALIREIGIQVKAI